MLRVTSKEELEDGTVRKRKSQVVLFFQLGLEQCLLGRSRVVLLQCLALVVCALGVRAWALRGGLEAADLSSVGRLSRIGRLRGAKTPAPRIPFNDLFNVSRPRPGDDGKASHLVIVAGHAVTVVEDLSEVESSDRAWYLLDYQRGKDLPEVFVSHIKRGVEVAAEDPDSILVFSGGQTRRDAGPRSEAQSYYFVAEHFDWWGRARSVASRAAVEEYARDSFENFVFSVCRFREIVGAYPKYITVVGFEFKRRRFVDLHAPAIGWPRGALEYEGLDPDPASRFDLAAARAGERASALVPYETDPYGCRGVLASKRAERNPFKRTVAYAQSCPEMAEMLVYCGSQRYNGSLPWRRANA